MKVREGIKFLLCIFSIFFILMNGVEAADLDVVYDISGWSDIGEIDVQFIKEKFNLNEAVATFNGDFEFRTNEGYLIENNVIASADFERFESERDEKVTYDIAEHGDKLVVYTGALDVGENTIDGGFILKFPNAAVLQDGTLCDVTMTVSNIVIKNNISVTKPVFLLRTSSSTQRMWSGIAYARQESKTGRALLEIGASYDLAFKVTEASSGELVTGAVGISFHDIDVGDKTVPKDADGNHDINGQYAESITIMTSLFENEKIHRISDSENWLTISDTSEFGRNTMFKAKVNRNLQDDLERKKTGFATRVNADDFKYRRIGSHAEMEMGFFDTKVVETSTSGDYPNNVKITETDNEVFWKEDKVIEMVPDDGYYISNITIDGVVIPYEELTDLENGYMLDGITYKFSEKDGIVTYIFNEVITDHKIDVQVKKKTVSETEEIDNPQMGVTSKIVSMALLLIASLIGLFMSTRTVKKI